MTTAGDGGTGGGAAGGGTGGGAREADRIPDGFGGAVLVARGGSTLLRAARGVADAGTGEPCTPGTRFQIASVSKQFTALAVLSLAEEGVLDLHRPLVEWMPELPSAWTKLTLHHLLTHTAGLVHWAGIPGWDLRAPGTPEQVLRRVARVPLLAPPGARWHYSSPGYVLAARAAERITGLPHPTLLRERVFGPLGMTATSAGSVPLHRAARGHRAGRPVDAARFAELTGTGDVWSTVDDLARYARAFDAGAILADRSRALLCTAHATPAGEPDDPLTEEGYGYGVFLGTLDGRRARFHPGDNPGYRSLLVRLPDQDVTVVVLSNHDEGDPHAVLRLLLPLLAQPAGGAPSTSARS